MIAARRYARVARVPDGIVPLGDELDLVRRDRCRRTQVQKEVAGRVEPPLAHERLLAAARLELEPMIEALRPGKDDTATWHPVECHRLLDLRSIPDDDAVGQLPNLSFVGEIVPTRHAECCRNPEGACTLNIVNLGRVEQYQWRYKNDIS